MSGVDALVRQHQRSVAVGAAAGISRAVKLGVERELPLTIRSLGQAFELRALPRGQLRAVNRAIAESAQDAVLANYRSRLPRGGRSSAYSELSGTLGPALASESMLAGTTDRTISFVNPETLGQQAKHWYRINYGARGPNLTKPGGQQPETYTVNLNGRPLMVLRDTHSPAPTSWLPERFEWDGIDFRATRGPATPRGKGSRAARFLDPGFERVAREFGPAYVRLFNDFVRTAPGRARLTNKGITLLTDVRAETLGFTVSVT